MSSPVSKIREPLITGNKTYHQITEDLISPTEKDTTSFLDDWIYRSRNLSCRVCIYRRMDHLSRYWYLESKQDHRMGWDITNFVWWVGIGHAGTLISAILLIFRQKWRTGVNRAAGEAMTIFAVICAGQFPIIHMGRVWLQYLSSLIPTPEVHCGPTSTHRCCGTYLRSVPTLQYPSCFGIQVWYRILQL